MEWSAKSPLQWDWENLIMLNSKATECPKKSRPSEWAIDGEGFADFGSFYSPPEGRAGCASGSDLGHASSKSSKPASISSPSIGDIKTSTFFFEAFNDMSEDFGNGKGFTDPHMTDKSRGYGESLLGLKLGRQTYPEDVSAGGNSKTTSLYAIPTPSETPTKKSKTVCLSTHAQRCQVEGCNLDLSSAKDYHRKHRVCENHSKCPKVTVGGQERRFCQQCSRFHGLSEFDEKKRSCRRRLSDHNARRRKPQPEAVQLNQGRLCSFNDTRQQMNSVLNRSPMVQARAATTLSWESTCLPAFTQTRGYPCKVTKPGVVDGQLISFGSNELPASVARVCHDPGRLLPSKATSTEVLKGVEESGISSNMEESRDLHRALSLLSTDVWSSCEPKPASPPTTVHARNSESWYAVQEPARSEARRFQEFQLLKPPFDGGFYPH